MCAHVCLCMVLGMKSRALHILSPIFSLAVSFIFLPHQFPEQEFVRLSAVFGDNSISPCSFCLLLDQMLCWLLVAGSHLNVPIVELTADFILLI